MAQPAVRGFQLSLIGSVLLHLLVLALVSLNLARRNQSPIPQTPALTWIEIEPTVTKSQDQHRVVDTAQGELTELPPKDAFLGARNQVVRKQMIGKARALSETPSRAQSPAQSQRPAKLALTDLGIHIAGAVQQQQNEARTSEYVKGMEEGKETFLNTKEFVYFGYFQRIREKLDLAWGPLLRGSLSKLYRRGRHLASESEHITRLIVTLNKAGEITRVKIIDASGFEELDATAIDAFNQAGPFPNPPKGIVDLKGEIEIPWEFILRT